jgi:hypothetical protein
MIGFSIYSDEAMYQVSKCTLLKDPNVSSERNETPEMQSDARSVPDNKFSQEKKKGWYLKNPVADHHFHLEEECKRTCSQGRNERRRREEKRRK